MCLTALDQSVHQLHRLIQGKVYGLPARLCKWTGEEKVFNDLVLPLVAHHIDIIILDINVPALQHCLRVKSVHQD